MGRAPSEATICGKAEEASTTEMISLVIQSCIGLVFTVYGAFSLLQARKNKGKGSIALACVLVGVVLLVYAAAR